MVDRYTVSGSGYILQDGKVFERQHLASAQEAVVELLNKQAERIVELESALHEVPVDPYQTDMCHIDSKEYVKLIPDPAMRTGISWYLMGEGYRVAVGAFQRIRDELKIEECE